jgi:hypothetical protein
MKMEQRINIQEKGRGALKALYGLGAYLAGSRIKAPRLD